MSLKSVFKAQLAQQRVEVARQALAQVLRGGLPANMTMGELLEEIREDEDLWSAFQGLRFGELTDIVAPPRGASGIAPMGPTRKRGVTSGRIIEYIRNNPGARRNELMKALGLLGGTVSSQLRTLRMTGRIRGEGPERNFQYYVD